MENPIVQEIRDGLDELFLGTSNEITDKSRELFKSLGIEGFADIMARSKKYGFNVSQKVLQDLTKLSFLIYANVDKLPIQKKIILPSISGSYKFIVTSLPHKFLRGSSDPMFENEDTNTLLLVSTGDDMHSKIAEKIGLKSKLYGEINILGGAWIDIDHENKKLNIRDDSGSYGSCSDQMVMWMLQEYIEKGYTINIGMTNQREFFTSQGEISPKIILEKKLELLHNLLVPSDIPIVLAKELSAYQQDFQRFQKSTEGIIDSFDEKYISALREFRDILLQDI